jgi:uncharacterized protein YaaR (DUF327 family)
MRIDEKTEARRIDKKTKGAASKSVAGTGSALFAGRLSQVAKSSSTGEYVGELQRLKEEVDKAGDNLEREPTIANFKVFRELIAALAKKVSAEAYRIETVGGGFSGRTHEVMTVIDKEADLLYHLVMREQKDHIRILAQIMKIKGLVVDLLL